MSWDELTQGEQRIAELVAEHLTNREIGQRLYIERSTVHWHLKNVFKKLGISSRTELAELVHARRESREDEVIHLDDKTRVR